MKEAGTSHLAITTVLLRTVWLGNRILDRLIREDADEVTRDAAKNDLSDDLYRQLSQMVYNAKVQWQLLQEASPSDAAEEASRVPLPRDSDPLDAMETVVCLTGGCP